MNSYFQSKQVIHFHIINLNSIQQFSPLPLNPHPSDPSSLLKPVVAVAICLTPLGELPTKSYPAPNLFSRSCYTRFILRKEGVYNTRLGEPTPRPKKPKAYSPDSYDQRSNLVWHQSCTEDRTTRHIPACREWHLLKTLLFRSNQID
jgi:hypothetical protein